MKMNVYLLLNRLVGRMLLTCCRFFKFFDDKVWFHSLWMFWIFLMLQSFNYLMSKRRCCLNFCVGAFHWVWGFCLGVLFCYYRHFFYWHLRFWIDFYAGSDNSLSANNFPGVIFVDRVDFKVIFFFSRRSRDYRWVRNGRWDSFCFLWFISFWDWFRVRFLLWYFFLLSIAHQWGPIGGFWSGRGLFFWRGIIRRSLIIWLRLVFGLRVGSSFYLVLSDRLSVLISCFRFRIRVSHFISRIRIFGCWWVRGSWWRTCPFPLWSIISHRC